MAQSTSSAQLFRLEGTFQIQLLLFPHPQTPIFFFLKKKGYLMFAVFSEY